MPAPLELEGQSFVDVEVVCREGSSACGKTLWRCRCKCGDEFLATAGNLKSGGTKRCRKCGDAHGADIRSTHGQTRGAEPTRAYIAWQNMRARCDPATTHKQWKKDYVGRGICYDPDWESFERFLADVGEPGEKQSLDRIDNDGMYCKANCRWTDRVTQRHNSRGIHWVVVEGVRMTLTDAVKKHSTVSYGNVCSRLSRGWNEQEAIMLPKSHRWSRR